MIPLFTPVLVCALAAEVAYAAPSSEGDASSASILARGAGEPVSQLQQCNAALMKTI